MKRILSNALLIISVLGVFALSGVSEDMNVQLPYSLTCLAIVALSAWGWTKLNPKEED